LAITGIYNSSLILFIIYQSELPYLSLFYSFVLPWTVNTEHPAASIFLASSIVFSSFYNILILHNTGTFKFSCNVLTIEQINSGSDNKKDP